MKRVIGKFHSNTSASMINGTIETHLMPFGTTKLYKTKAKIKYNGLAKTAELANGLEFDIDVDPSLNFNLITPYGPIKFKILKTGILEDGKFHVNGEYETNFNKNVFHGILKDKGKFYLHYV